MSMLLKKIRHSFKNILLGPYPVSDFLAIGVPPTSDTLGQWSVGNQKLEVRIAFLMYDLPLVALNLERLPVVPKKDRQLPSRLTFMGLDKKEVLGTMELSAKPQLELNDEALLIYQIVDSELFLGSIRQWLVNKIVFGRLKKDHKSFLSHFNRKIYRIISNFFLYPREVKLLTLRCGDASLLRFPLDLYMCASGHVYFSLRKTNKGVAQLTEGTALCLSDVQAAYRNTIYKLGKFGGDDEEGLEMVESEKLKLPIPMVYNYYQELEIVEIFPFEHQCLFQAQVINEFKAKEQKQVLAHIQRLRYSRCPPAYQHELL